MRNEAQKNWDEEYRRRGIPSSSRVDPSSVVVWATRNWGLLSARTRPETALDVGCGTGRNVIFLANSGMKVDGFDLSTEAVGRARKQIASAGVAPELAHVFRHDLRDGIPFPEDSFDLITDTFVYKHLVDADIRGSYLHEVRRVLRPNGCFLLSLAHADDEFYAGCPNHQTWTGVGPRVVVDPVANIGSVLFSQTELEEEVGGDFQLQMLWRKIRPGEMHGEVYMRDTLATLWRANPTNQ